jgi:hypothetical protein
MPDTQPVDLAVLNAAYAKMSPGPWKSWGYEITDANRDWLLCTDDNEYEEPEGDALNCQGIVAIVNAFPAMAEELKRLREQLERLHKAVEPFRALARTIPDNWPAQCPLRIDSGPDRKGRQYEWIAYHGVGNDGKNTDCDSLLPTIGEWRSLIP